MNTILYITSNQNKIDTANRLLKPFNIEIEGLKVEGIVEPQTEDITEISKMKAQQAFEKVQKPLIVSDASWIIPSLNGFPGPYMHFVNKWFTSKDFLNLMKGKENREIILRECVTYIDKDNIKTFISDTKGFFVNKAEGKATPLDQVVSFREDGKTIAQCENENKMRIPQNGLWNDVGKWLKENALE
ncbi:MAG: non-canonical purine NTP pyrophosphatase [Candidatus Dojkabacteria bacterium]|jgi:non-canonical purine NTP pyrophosphatase (RdgB/HAM1 family)|nr:non-canonical purine NTP pyrophosphatase [Candidatus Dojkabacteria bacterium]